MKLPCWDTEWAALHIDTSGRYPLEGKWPKSHLFYCSTSTRGYDWASLMTKGHLVFKICSRTFVHLFEIPALQSKHCVFLNSGRGLMLITLMSFSLEQAVFVISSQSVLTLGVEEKYMSIHLPWCHTHSPGWRSVIHPCMAYIQSALWDSLIVKSSQKAICTKSTGMFSFNVVARPALNPIQSTKY